MADHNLDVFSFPAWNAAALRVNNGTGVGRVLFVGDSTMEGAFISAYSKNLVQQMELLNPAATDGAIWGSTVYGPDLRVSMGTGWVFWGNQGYGSGDRQWSAPTTATGNLSITPTNPFDKIVIYYAEPASGSGSFVVDVDGGSSLGTINTSSGSNAVNKTTLTCTAGHHTINLHPPTSNTVFILGIEWYLSTTPTLLYSNAGSTGTQFSWWVSAGLPWEAIPQWDIYQPDLTIISLGINDARIGGTDLPTSAGYCADIIAKAQTYGDVLLCSMIPSQPLVDGTWPREQTLMPLLEAAAVSAGCGYFDLTLAGRFVDWNTASGNGYMHDQYHTSDAGDAFWAGLLNTALVSITGSLPPAPVNTVAPSIVGSPVIGQTLTADPGTWINTVGSFSYQWQFSVDGLTNWSDMVGKTASTLPLV